MSRQKVWIPGRHWLIDEQTGCWEWAGYKLRGYAWSGRPAHRAVYEQIVGAIPAGHDLHHGCENPGCVNPAHMEPRPVHLHRSAHKRALSSLTEADVVEIREAAAGGVFLVELAEKYGLHHNTVRDIVSGRHWADVGGPVGLPERVCPMCGEKVPPTRLRHARYCSIRCRQTFNRRKAGRS